MGARRTTRGSGAAATTPPVKPPSHWSVDIANGVRAVGGKDGSKFAAASASSTSAKTRNAVAEAARTLFARLTSAYAETSTTSGALPLEDGELTTEGLDAEQVWTQMEAQTTPVLEACKRAIKALGKRVKSGESGEDVDVDALFDVDADESQSDDDDDEEDDDDDEDASEDASDDGDEDSEEANARSKSGKKSGGSDRTSKYFRNPGMFSLDDMENFLDEAEEEAEERRKVEDEKEDGDSDEERDSEDEDDSDDEGDIYRELSESDDDDDDEEDSEEADDLDDALAYTAKLAGVSASTRRKKDKKSKGKKAQDMMFEDFFGKHKGKPLGGTKGGKLGASTDAELNELSDEEEDMFNELEGDEDLDEEDDDLEGELETGIAGNRGLENHDDDEDEYMEEDEEEDEELDVGGDEEMDALDKQLDAQLDAEIARAEEEGDYDDDDEDVGKSAQPKAKSAFQRQQEALARQMDKLESAALGEKSWLLKGEADAKQRPLNSALETDLEFEHVMAPAPVISAEITQKLEDIIKQRIIEGRFDDVERIEPVQERERKEAPQLDDTKSTKGLGEIYADEYMKQKVGVALGEKEDPIVAEVKKLWALLSYRLDALSRTGFVEEPKDIEARIDRELALKAQGNLVPATFNEATHQAPEEIFAGGDGKGGQRGSAAGNIKADDELTKEERKAGRAKRKRKSKAVREEKDRIKSQRDRQREAQLKAQEEAGFTRKAPKVAMLAAAPAGGKSKSDFSKSSKVFGMLQEAKEADAARGGPLKKSKSDSTKNKSSLKL
jgi:U3 small nucleolar RNA-associated protein MPP10